jgi:Xaa-Pro aminopeptidase
LDYAKRSSRIVEKVGSKGPVDFIAVTTMPSLRYFFNYAGNSYERFCCGIIADGGDKTALVVPKLDEQKAEKSVAKNVYAWTDGEGYSKALVSAVSDLNLSGSHIGCELGISLGQMDSFKDSLGAANFTALSDEITSLRQLKDQSEIEALRESARILARAYKAIPEFLRKGVTESSVAFDIKRELTERGAQGLGAGLVQSGSNSAIPHSEPSSRKIGKGDMVVIDISCSAEAGYVADFTRTYVIGKPTKLQTDVYAAVKRAQAVGVQSSISGCSAEEVDSATRAVIAKAGYGEQFVHRTGHGLGLEVHEPPWINRGNSQELERGMVFTIEPGIYLPGKFGVRIEDNVVIEKKTASNLTALSHDLVEI